MKIFTMGSSGKTAEEFFNNIDKNKVELLLDVRLHNHSQLLGFTKGIDLEYFLDKLSSCEYVHDEMFCTTEDVLKEYRKKTIGWKEYKKHYLELMKKRDMVSLFKKEHGNHDNVLILCSEKEPDTCHRILLADKLAEKPEDVTHL
ncbi:DUF488 family protein [Methanobrevibacter arboriphilus]|uniref:DUF488 domain-containing protein n=2 Tax=Methanobrevibacter arboriphilus TaxID=39441 RepID=UPI0005B258C0|nr:DUF488 domain-containing protein [Methanobrevibacter arboriphilus]